MGLVLLKKTNLRCPPQPPPLRGQLAAGRSRSRSRSATRGHFSTGRGTGGGGGGARRQPRGCPAGPGPTVGTRSGVQGSGVQGSAVSSAEAPRRRVGARSRVTHGISACWRAVSSSRRLRWHRAWGPRRWARSHRRSPPAPALAITAEKSADARHGWLFPLGRAGNVPW